MRWWVISILLAVAVGAPSGCAKKPAPAPTAAAPSSSQLNLAFAGAKPGGKLAHLSYAVQAPSGPLRMELTDPKSPQGTVAKLPVATLRLGPYVMKPVITAKRMQECLVNGCYTLCVRDALGTHVGDFEINPWGALVLKRGTVDESLEVERATGNGRTVYFAFRKKPGGERGGIQFALEFKRHKGITRHDLTAADGWHYTFASPDGVLTVHDPAGLDKLLDELRLAEAIAKGMTREQLEKWAEENQSTRTGRPKFGDAPPPPAEYCTGGG